MSQALTNSTVGQRMRLYWTPHKSRRREREFVEFLAAKLDVEIFNQRLDLDPAHLDSLIDREELLGCLVADRRLSPRKRQDCIEEVRNLPAKIRVAMEPSRVSFDLVVEQAGRSHYLEFHEEQHRNLKDNRPKTIFETSGNGIAVPRYLQRFIRDFWRMTTFPNFTIVWFDWFEANREAYSPSFAGGFHEYHLEGQFSFKAFLAKDCPHASGSGA